MILLVAAVCAQEPVFVDASGYEPIVSGLAEDAAWCQNERALFASDGAWCEEVPPGCPGMRARCAATPGDSWWERLLEWLAEWRAKTPEATEPLFTLPDLRGLLIGLFAAVAALGVVLVLRGLLRGTLRAPDPAPQVVRGTVAGPDGGPLPLAEADAAAMAGRFEEALMLLRALAIRALADRGVVRDDPMPVKAAGGHACGHS